jgi:nucleoprotein TPR
MDHVVSLYKEEIATYQQQIDDLKQRNRDCEQKNSILISKINDLENLIEKANVANRDLNIAFEHLHQENLRLQVNQEALMVNNPKQVAETNVRNDEPTTDSLIWISEREQFKQRNKFLERECERYHRDNIHLGKQVRHLLKTLEEERGMIIRRQSQVTQDNNQITCAADVIDKHLITFESIEELQQQNQKLLSLVKDLSAEQEEREARIESEEVKRLTTDLEELKTQLDTIKSDRERVLNALNVIHKERDLFKILLCKTRQVEHLTPEIFQRMVSVACSSGPAITATDSSSTEREAHIEDLKKMISNLEWNIESIKKEFEESRAASDAELKVKSQLLEKAHLKISEVTKTLEAANERNELLESNIKALTTEFDDLRTKCQKMTLELEESRNKIENAENQSKEFSKSLNVERQRAQDALIKASQYEEQAQQLLESLEREKRSRQQELASLFKDLQNKQVELQEKLNRAHQDFLNMQLERNFERARRIRLDRMVNGRPKSSSNRLELAVTKITKKRKRVHYAEPNVSKVEPKESSSEKQQYREHKPVDQQRSVEEISLVEDGLVDEQRLTENIDSNAKSGFIKLKRRKFD